MGANSAYADGGTAEAFGHLVSSQAQTHAFFCVSLGLILVGRDALELGIFRCRPESEEVNDGLIRYSDCRASRISVAHVSLDMYTKLHAVREPRH